MKITMIPVQMIPVHKIYSHPNNPRTDLGDTVQDIAKQTGFSENTVRNRVKIAVFDPDKMAEVEGRGATMKDYLDLAKIEDEDLRNEVLASIGTANFRNELARAKSTLRDRKNRAEQIAALQSFAQKVEQTATDGMKFVRSLYSSDAADKIVPDDKDTVKYFFVENAYSISLYREKTAADDAIENEHQILAAAIKDKAVAIDEATKRAAQLRKDFVNLLTSGKVRQHFGAVISAVGTQFLSFAHNGYTYLRLDHEILRDLLGIPLNSKKEVDVKDLQASADSSPDWTLFSIAFAMLEAGEQKYYSEEWISNVGYAYVHCKNDTMDRCYNMLIALDYEMSDEEKQLRDGTHPMFYVKPAAKKTA